MILDDDFCFSGKEFGGGVTLDIGIYAVQLSQFVYNGQIPTSITAVGELNNDGVDQTVR